MSRCVRFLIPACCLLLHCVAAAAQVSEPANSARTGTFHLSTAFSTAEAEFRAGLDAWQNFGYTEAQHHFERALALDSSFALARVFIAEAAVQRGFPLRSADIDRGVAEAAHATTEETVLALAWREKAAGRNRSAASLLHAAMELMPNEPRVATEYAWSLFAYDMATALEAARAARARFPSFGPVSPLLTSLLLQTGDTAAALAEARGYTELESARPVSFVYYGRLLQLLGRLPEAEAQYRRSLVLALPQGEAPYDGYEALAEVLELQGKTEGARQVISEALRNARSTSDSIRYFQLLGGTQLFADDTAGALRSFAEVRRLWPTLGAEAGVDPSGLYSALVDAAFGDARSVPKYLADVRSGLRDSVPFAFSLVGIYAYASQPESTFKYADRLAALGMSNQLAVPVSHFARGELYLKRHRCDKALEQFRQSDSTWIEVQAGIAECEMQSGRRDVALRWRDLALANRAVNLLDPGEIHARVRMRQLR